MNILTFDIEDWWVYDYYAIGRSVDYLPRLDWYLNEILDLLDKKKYLATFFCLGEVAKNYPEVIKKIADKGHQIGCHSFSHRFLGDLSPHEVEEDTKKALDIIENLIGKKVTVYRAPAFSITERNLWVFEILSKYGIKYDCSIFPANRSFGGFPSFTETKPSVIDYKGIKIKEFPMSTTTILTKKIVYSGGGFFRLLPYSIIKSLVKRSDYVMTYFHVKDFDKNQKKIYNSFHGESAITRYFKKYYGLNNNFQKFVQFINDFEFISVEEANKKIDWNTIKIDI